MFCHNNNGIPNHEQLSRAILSCLLMLCLCDHPFITESIEQRGPAPRPTYMSVALSADACSVSAASAASPS
jgi:hypothetical protein